MIVWPEGTSGVLLDEIDSTNREAERRALQGEAGPIWIAARSQHAGRGRQGRRWISPQGNLFASHLSVFAGSPAQAALLSFVASLAVADTLAHFAPHAEVTLKWPNDVLLNQGKASGILLESVSGGVVGPLRVIIGIGLNLAHAPPADQTRWPATSLAAVTGTAPSPEVAAEVLAHALARRLEVFSRDGFPAIRAAWLGRAAHLGQEIEARLPGEVLSGRFTDLDVDGALVLEDGAKRRRIAAADVFLPGVS